MLMTSTNTNANYTQSMLQNITHYHENELAERNTVSVTMFTTVEK